MPIVLPDLNGANCPSLTVCGFLSAKDKKLNALFKSEKRLLVPFRKANTSGFIRLILGGHSRNHVHIDVATRQFFQGESKPKTNGTIDDFQKAIEPFIGYEIESGLIGTFEINPNDVPASGMIRSMAVETKTGNVGIKMSGAKFSVTGAPVREISWSERSSEKFSVNLRTQFLKLKIADDYLIEALKTLQKSLSVFVYGKTSYEPLPANA